MNIRKLTSEYLPPALARAVGRDLAAMESALSVLCGEAGELAPGLVRVNGAGGKRLRPLLARLSMEFGEKPGEIVPLMTMLELMHTCSLVHDDFVDGAAQRRGVAAISASEGPLAALRSGDYLLSRAMARLKIYRGTGINELLSDVAQEMCLGELEQYAGLYRLRGVTEADYDLRIRRKTALLLSASCRTGAIAGGADKATCEALADYGLQLGIAFQLQDDLLDCLPEAETGKPRFQDLRSGVITLPLLLAAQCRGEDFLALAEQKEKTAVELETLRCAIADCGALGESAAVLRETGDAAAAALSPLPDGPVKRAFTVLAQSISEVKFRG